MYRINTEIGNLAVRSFCKGKSVYIIGCRAEGIIVETEGAHGLKLNQAQGTSYSQDTESLLAHAVENFDSYNIALRAVCQC